MKLLVICHYGFGHPEATLHPYGTKKSHWKGGQRHQHQRRKLAHLICRKQMTLPSPLTLNSIQCLPLLNHNPTTPRNTRRRRSGALKTTAPVSFLTFAAFAAAAASAVFLPLKATLLPQILTHPIHLHHHCLGQCWERRLNQIDRDCSPRYRRSTKVSIGFFYSAHKHQPHKLSLTPSNTTT